MVRKGMHLQTAARLEAEMAALRKAGIILSLFFACVDMPCRVARGHGGQFKEYGARDGAKCILKGRGLTDRDLARLKDGQWWQCCLT